jgi:preprotein translocase subunit YajC
LWSNAEISGGLAPARLEIKMKARAFALLLSLAMMACAALAHGDKKHISGTVEKIGADSVTVKTAEGKSVEVKLVAATTYVMRSGTVDKPATLSDLAVGDRVVIHATPKGEILEAAEVRFSAAAATATSKPKS